MTINAVRNKAVVAAIILCAICSWACNHERSHDLNEVPGVVLLPGEWVTANFQKAAVSITHSAKDVREIRVGDNKYLVTCRIRPEKFKYDGMIGDGISGIYSPGSGAIKPDGTRIVYMESVRNFSSMDELERFLLQGSAVYSHGCTSDGLMLSIEIKNSGKQVSINLWRLLVNGITPSVSAESAGLSPSIKNIKIEAGKP
jgi:hypothetical protein